MTVFYFIIIFLPIAIMLLASICAMFKIGVKEGICKFDYIEEDEDDLPKDDK